MKVILTPIKVWLKEHLTILPSPWDRKVMPLHSFVGSDGVVRGCRLAWTGLPPTHAALTPAKSASCCFLNAAKLFHAFLKGTCCSLYGEDREPGSLPILYLVATLPLPLGLSSKISFFGKSPPLPQAVLFTSLCSVTDLAIPISQAGKI